MESVAGAVAVVTGGASGIGLALAQRFAREGTAVGVRREPLGRRQRRADTTVRSSQAPNGSNQQEWQWIVVDDADVKAQLAELSREGMTHFGSNPYFAGPTPDWSDSALLKIGSSARNLMDNLHRVPVMVIPTIEARPEGIDLFLQANLWGSILPAVWSFMLALRDRGLGSAWTTVHLHRAREAADLLGIPHDRYTQAGLFPVAYTLGTDFRPGPRRPLGEVLHWNHWST